MHLESLGTYVLHGTSFQPCSCTTVTDGVWNKDWIEVLGIFTPSFLGCQFALFFYHVQLRVYWCNCLDSTWHQRHFPIRWKSLRRLWKEKITCILLVFLDINILALYQSLCIPSQNLGCYCKSPSIFAILVTAIFIVLGKTQSMPFLIRLV